MLHTSSGFPEPLGVTPDEGGVNVAVYSKYATTIEFCLFDATGEQQTHAIALPGRTGDVFHAYVAGVGVGARYGLRAHGADAPTLGHRFNPEKLLVDPYALCLDRHFVLDSKQFSSGEHKTADSAASMPKAIVINRTELCKPFSPLRVPWSSTVIYELHVRGFTRLHPEIPNQIRGTFAALASVDAISHLRDLGVTTVEIMPAAAWVDERHLPRLGLSNYWGYNPVALMAPDPRLAPGGWPEIRQAVEALHAAGLEVILDVVLNHSGESDEFGPTLSLRGLDNASYYRLFSNDPEHYINDSGCGNCLALNRPAVLRLAMDCLRTWVELGGVDGFRFDLATSLGREEGTFNPAAPLLAAIAQDPLLRQAKLIAEPWDVGPGGYRIGGFPAQYGEWNDHFRDDVRRFWRGDEGLRGALATRLAGSADVFAGKHLASRSINFITAHDGFTLADLVSYAHKRNDPNGEHNRDGTDSNFSWNHGHEGPCDDETCHTLRGRDQRNLLATLLLSRGTPMLSMGAELGITQHGNNNAYAQDNPLTWLDWAQADPALIAFTRDLIALRRAHPALRAEPFLTGGVSAESGLADVEWRSARAPLHGDAEWNSPDDATLVAVFSVDVAGGDADRVAVALNPGYHHEPLILPDARRNFFWRRVLSTASCLGQDDMSLPARSLVLFAEYPAQSRTSRPPDSHLLARLSGAVGIAPEWWDIAGNQHIVSEETQRALLSAMKLDVATQSQAWDSLMQTVGSRTTRLLPESHMVYAGEASMLLVTRAPADAFPLAALLLRDASGNLVATLAPRWRAHAPLTDSLGRVLRVLSLPLPRLEAGHYTAFFENMPYTICHLTAAPRRCHLPATWPAQHFGISVQSYSLRRAGDAGIGDFCALAQFASLAGQHGAALLGIQPLHMLCPAARERASPYHPSDRRYLDPIHLALDALHDIPGFTPAPSTPPGDSLNYPAIWLEKSRFLQNLFDGFVAAARILPNHPMVRKFESFIAAGGEQLEGFANFQVISALYPGTSWQRWPAALRDAASAQVRELARRHREQHRYALFLQFLCDHQLSAAAAAARAGGLALGLYRDLAVGCAPDGAEAWANADTFARGVSIGAPPDPLGPQGQMWNLPPPDPLAWQRTNFASFRAAAAANMRHAGALRIDHVLGLSRLFWIPEGGRARDGAYVHYPLATLTGHLSLESQKASCLVVGEDLGTVPDGLRETLAAAGVLSYRVMMLERTAEDFIAPRLYPAAALACAATHDLPPLAGWWQGTDIAERHALGLIDASASLSQHGLRQHEKQALRRALAADGIVLPDVDSERLSPAMLAAIHKWLARAPSALLMVQAEDLAGETISQNLPGTNLERPNWRHRLPFTAAELFATERARLSLLALHARASS
nr:glycogen debranching protein GlgX [Acidocella sp.]